MSYAIAAEGFGFKSDSARAALHLLRFAPGIVQIGPDVAADLGIGARQAKELAAWLRWAGVTEESRGNGTLLSPLGLVIAAYDPTLSQIATWWCLHWRLSTSPDFGSWRLLSPTTSCRFSLRELEEQLLRLAPGLSERAVSKGRQAVVTTLLSTPLGQRLGLVEWEEERGRVVALIGRRVHHGEIPLAAVGYAVLDWARREGASGAALEVLAAEGGPGPVLHLGVGDLERYLMDLHSDFGGQVLTYSRTADLDQAYFRSEVTPLQVLAAHYLRERENLSWAQALDRARQEVPADDAPR